MVHVSIKAEPLFAIGPWVITNSMVGALLASAVLLAAAIYVSRRAQLVPTRLQSLVELPFEFVYGVVRAQGGKPWRTILPLIATIFMFVLVANWIGILPGVGTIGYFEHGEHGEEILVPFVRAASADLNFTLGLALVSFVTFLGLGIRARGVGGYLKEMFVANPPYMSPLMGPIHLISELSRLISLSMRLFGNVFAGEVLMLVLLVIGPFVLFMAIGLELLFGLVQALVFALLTMTYVVLATVEHESSHAETDHPPAESAAHT